MQSRFHFIFTFITIIYNSTIVHPVIPCRGTQSPSPDSTEDEAKQKPKEVKASLKSPPILNEEDPNTKLPASDSPFSNCYEILQEESPWEDEGGNTPTDEVDTSRKPRTREHAPKNYDESPMTLDKSRHSSSNSTRSHQSNSSTSSRSSANSSLTKAVSTCAQARPLFQPQFFDLLKHLFNWHDNNPIHEIFESLIEVQVTTWNTFVTTEQSCFNDLQIHGIRTPHTVTSFSKRRLINLHQMVLD